MAFNLDPKPTFQTEVRITIPGGGYLPLPLVFKHMTRSQIEAWAKRDQTDLEMLLEIVHSAPTQPEGLTLAQFLSELVENFPASPLDVYVTFRAELQESRAKN